MANQNVVTLIRARLLPALGIAVLGIAVPANANELDSILARHHARAGVAHTEICDDDVFLRRVTLDLAGRIPSLDEIRSFRDNPDRQQRVNELLAANSFADYWSDLWATILIGRQTDRQAKREPLRVWLEQQFRDDVPLNQVAFNLISAQGVTSLDGAVNFMVANREDPVTAVSRVFLGVQLDCARCHDHPYDRWTQDDYSSMRGFFATVQFKEVTGGYRLSDQAGSTSYEDSTFNKGTAPRFLTGAQPRTAAWRRELALMTVRSKPFARAMGNRIWQLLMGRGVVNPVDGLSQENPPSVPELHDGLAKRLAENQFRLKALIREICLSDAYARRCVAPSQIAPSQLDRREHEKQVSVFAGRACDRSLLPEQLVRSYCVAADQEIPSATRCNALAIKFIGRSATPPGPTDPIATKRTSQGLLHELAHQTPTPSGDLEKLYLRVLGRKPTAWERERLSQVPRNDLMHALLHCNEFLFYP